jgi:hypothetical protein
MKKVLIWIWKGNNMSSFRFIKPVLNLENCELTKYQLWCCGLCGILTELNCSNHYLLESKKITPRNIERIKVMLEEWWNVYNRNDLLNTLKWLEEEGHSAEFEDLAEFFAENPELSDADLERICEEDEELCFSQLDCVRKYYQLVGDRFIKAWDYGRYVFLCRDGYVCQYFSREEALSLIEELGRRVRAEFHSWKDFGENYCIGRRFWASDDPYKEIEMYRDACKAFQALLKEDGAWTQILWEWSNC